MAKDADTERAEKEAVAAHKAVERFKAQKKRRETAGGCLMLIVVVGLLMWQCTPEGTWKGALEEIRSGGSVGEDKPARQKGN